MAAPEPLHFDDILVAPTQSIIGHRPVVDCQAGPLWPDFEAQTVARHCREREPKPFDTAPTPPASIAATLPEAVWCGPLCTHFGHAVGDFATRIPHSAHLRPDLPLLFSHWPGGEAEVPGFFPGILAQLGVAPSRIVIATEALRVGRLHVFPQAERIHGGPPAREYLALLQRHAPPNADAALRDATVFLSRSRIRPDTLIGRIAGEAYLDEVLRAAGCLVAYPEELSVPEQMRLYASAGRLLFSEGSALHGLQLLGGVRAEVAVVTRRPKGRMAVGAVTPRVAALHWIDATRGILRGRRRDGRGLDTGRGITVLDEAALAAQLGAAFGLDLAPHWDNAAWQAACHADIRRWVKAWRAFALRRGNPPDEPAVIAQALEALGLGALA
jgi:hypothetical protein